MLLPKAFVIIENYFLIIKFEQRFFFFCIREKGELEGSYCNQQMKPVVE